MASSASGLDLLPCIMLVTRLLSPYVPCHTATARKMLRNDVRTTHLAVSVSASGLVSIVFGLVNDDLKHHVGLVHTWEHPAFNFVSNPTLFVTRTTLHSTTHLHDTSNVWQTDRRME